MAGLEKGQRAGQRTPWQTDDESISAPAESRALAIAQKAEFLDVHEASPHPPASEPVTSDHARRMWRG